MEEANRTSLCRQSVRGKSYEEASQGAARTLYRGGGRGGGDCLERKAPPHPLEGLRNREGGHRPDDEE